MFTDERKIILQIVVLAMCYSMGVKELANKLNCNLDKARSLHNRFFNLFPGIKKFTSRAIDIAKSNGFVTSLSGRRRYILSPVDAPRLAVNSIIQVMQYYLKYLIFYTPTLPIPF